MGRKNKYETHVRPYLSEIPKWYETMTERQIAKKLGISTASFENYKIKYPELVECLQKGKEILIDELKATLKTKAQGFYYSESKSIKIRDDNGNLIEVKRETYEKYSTPDTGAIHLLLKNLDSTWHNDDKTTLDLKREQLELAKQKVEDTW